MGEGTKLLSMMMNWSRNAEWEAEQVSSHSPYDQSTVATLAPLHVLGEAFKALLVTSALREKLTQSGDYLGLDVREPQSRRLFDANHLRLLPLQRDRESVWIMSRAS